MLVTIIASVALLGKLRKARDLFHTSTEIVTVGGFSIVGMGKQLLYEYVAAFTFVDLRTSRDSVRPPVTHIRGFDKR